jgi:hypothetical protein
VRERYGKDKDNRETGGKGREQGKRFTREREIKRERERER